MTTVRSGQTLDVPAGQTSNGILILAGGAVEVDGVVSNTVDFGLLTVPIGFDTGGFAIETAVGAGGLLSLGDNAESIVTIVSSGAFAVGDFLDLRDISFISGTTSASFTEAASNTSGTLTVSDGTHSANITLLGQYVAGQFNVASDGHGGAVVTDPPLIAANDDKSFLSQPKQV